MDIAKFNKELGYRVAKATGLESNNKIEEAIDEWVAISEMVIEASKTPNLEFSYKSMLIDKTKQIIEHIKSLKLKLTGEKQTAIIENISEFQEEYDIQSIKTEDTTESKEYNIDPTEIDTQKSKETKTIEENEFKNLPKGFTEIKASKDFEIVTPHDKDFVKKILSQDQPDLNVFKHKKEKNQIPRDQNEIICFACGVELPVNTKICPQCGSKQKK